MLNKQVVCLSKHLLLQIATPEAIVRLEHTVLAEDKSEVEYTYFQRQCHGSIEEFLNHHIHDTCWESGVLMQVTPSLHPSLPQDLLSHSKCTQ